MPIAHEARATPASIDPLDTTPMAARIQPSHEHFRARRPHFFAMRWPGVKNRLMQWLVSTAPFMTHQLSAAKQCNQPDPIQALDLVLVLLNSKGYFDSKAHQNEVIQAVKNIFSTFSLTPEFYCALVDKTHHRIHSVHRKQLLASMTPQDQLYDPALNRSMLNRKCLCQLAAVLLETTAYRNQIFEFSSVTANQLRFDKEKLKLRHSIVLDNSMMRPYALYSTIQMNNPYELEDIQKLYLHFDTLLPHTIQRSRQLLNPTMKLTLGFGGFAVVKPVLDLATNTFLATKKIKQTGQQALSRQDIVALTHREKVGNELLKNLLTEDELNFFHLQSGPVITTGHDQNPKAYFFSELHSNGNGREEIQSIHAAPPLPMGTLLDTVMKWVKGVEILEKYELCHPDLKPHNILDGKLGDLCDLVPLHDRESLTQLYSGELAHTGKYTPPDAAVYFFQSKYLNADDTLKLFRGYNRFTLGIMLIEAATNRHVCDQANQFRELYLPPAEIYRQGHQIILRVKEGYKEHQVRQIRIKLNQSKDLLDEQRLLITLGMNLARHNPFERISPTTVARQLAQARTYDVTPRQD